ncbi:MAG: hypothetical protein Q4G07_05075 [Oscillospiraceae bacterium]|nr:hypothetical protein [Oscillospiraceae bacterium]
MTRGEGAVPYSARILDAALWLGGPVYGRLPWAERLRLRDTAAAYGEELARRWPLAPCGEPAEALKKLGVAEVRFFEEDDLFQAREKACYLPDEKIVSCNRAFAPALLCAAPDARAELWDAQTVLWAVLLHEAFHHLEEHAAQPADLWMRRRGERAGPVYREIAACAYANALLPGYICQKIDALWLRACRPQQFETLLSLCAACAGQA